MIGLTARLEANLEQDRLQVGEAMSRWHLSHRPMRLAPESDRDGINRAIHVKPTAATRPVAKDYLWRDSGELQD